MEKQFKTSKSVQRKPRPRISNEAIQREAECMIIDRLQMQLQLSLKPHKVDLGTIEIDVGAMDIDKRCAFEIYPKVGNMKSGNRRKIAQDILKLSMVKKHYETGKPGFPFRTGIVLVDTEAKESLLGKTQDTWMKHAADLHGVEILLEQVNPMIRRRIERAQEKQGQLQR